MNNKCFINEWKNWPRVEAMSAHVKPISPDHSSPTYPQHLVEVVILWPLVVQQEGFPEKQDIQGEPDKLNIQKKWENEN